MSLIHIDEPIAIIAAMNACQRMNGLMARGVFSVNDLLSAGMAFDLEEGAEERKPTQADSLFVRVESRLPTTSHDSPGFLLAIDPRDNHPSEPDPACLVTTLRGLCDGVQLILPPKSNPPPVILWWRRPIQSAPFKVALHDTEKSGRYVFRVVPLFRTAELWLSPSSAEGLTLDDVRKAGRRLRRDLPLLSVGRAVVAGVERYVIRDQKEASLALAALRIGVDYMAGAQVTRREDGCWVPARAIIAGLPEAPSDEFVSVADTAARLELKPGRPPRRAL